MAGATPNPMTGAMGWSTLLNPMTPQPDPHQMERVATEKSALEAALNQQEKKLEKLSLEVRTLHTCTMHLCTHAPCVHIYRACTPRARAA